ncbi:MAG TPA: SNF2-related protein, partial [Methylomirabilota bacterium]|nr:SNF2-related protein [Methylomirabilota bacterium]
MLHRSDLRPYQVEAVRLAVERKRLALFLAPGDGKTAVALTALADLEAWPALVAAPAAVAEATWRDEAARWDHLQNLEVVSVVGSAAERRRALHDGFAHVEVVSYENLKWLSDEVDLGARYRAIVFDELSKMKHPGTGRFRRLRARAERIPVRLGLTGTPVGNHLLDIWGEMYMVAGAAALGPRYGDFRDQFFEAKGWKWKTYEPRPWAAKRVRELIAPFAYSLPPQPEARCELRVNELRVAMPAEAAALSERLVKELWATLPSGADLEALSASTVAVKLRQVSSGAVYLRPPKADDPGGKGPWEEVHGAKLVALGELLDELQGEPLLVFYWFGHELERISAMLRRRGVPFRRLESASDVLEWNRGGLEVLLAHPQSGGYGLNLQGGGHHVAWFALPWSHELWTQANAR